MIASDKMIVTGTYNHTRTMSPTFKSARAVKAVRPLYHGLKGDEGVKKMT